MATLAAKYQPYPTYKPSGVEWLGEIPAHWEVRRLKYSAPFGNGKLANKPEGATYVGLENIESWTGELLLDYQPDSVDSAVVTFVPGDVLFGKLRPYLAKVAHPDFGGTATSEVLVMRPLEECSQSYLAYCLLNAPYIRWIDTLTYGAKMPRVSPDEVACSAITLPPLPEQQTIAAFLDRETARVDALVAKKERLIDLLQEKRTALITRAVTRGLDPDAPMKDSGVEWLGEIPAHWEVERLKSIAEIRYGLGQPPKELPDGLPLIRATNVFRGHISDADMLYVDPGDVPVGRRAFLSAREIVVVRSGAYTADSAIIPKKYDGAIAGYDMVVTVNKARPEFIAIALLCPYIRDAQLVVASTRSAQPHLNAEELGGALILLPPHPEQTAITDFLDQETAKLDSLIVKIREAIKRLRELRSALISAAVTGRIDVRKEAGCQ